MCVHQHHNVPRILEHFLTACFTKVFTVILSLICLWQKNLVKVLKKCNISNVLLDCNFYIITDIFPHIINVDSAFSSRLSRISKYVLRF